MTQSKIKGEPLKTEHNGRDDKGRFVPGNSYGKGRPRNELSLTNLVREKLDEICPYDSQGRTWREYLVDRWLAHSIDNFPYFRELTERLEGKVLQPIGGENGEPIKYELNVKDTETKDLTERIIKGGSVVSNISLS